MGMPSKNLLYISGATKSASLPRWRDFFELPAMKCLMAFVKSDFDRQRDIVEAMDAEENFRAIVERLDVDSRSDSARLR